MSSVSPTEEISVKATTKKTTSAEYITIVYWIPPTRELPTTWENHSIKPLI
jgi:hypothetical protein